PAVLFANHHYFHDSYLVWHLLARALRRPPVVWMEKWREAPLFGPVGALPFPAEHPGARVASVRETARRMAADPRTGLFVFPEGKMHPPEEGLAPFRTDLARLVRLLPSATQWWPVGVYLTWWGEARPTALLGGAPPSDAPPDDARAVLAGVLERLAAVRPRHVAAGEAHVLLDGARGAGERWDLSALAPLFLRWTRRQA
ncbi:MAG: 1-acyl-sn-glycerol-3-phosphate acyltransferase, partial [Rubricoccaceae bacterium]